MNQQKRELMINLIEQHPKLLTKLFSATNPPRNEEEYKRVIERYVDGECNSKKICGKINAEINKIRLKISEINCDKVFGLGVYDQHNNRIKYLRRKLDEKKAELFELSWNKLEEATQSLRG